MKLPMIDDIMDEIIEWIILFIYFLVACELQGIPVQRKNPNRWLIFQRKRVSIGQPVIIAVTRCNS